MRALLFCCLPLAACVGTSSSEPAWWQEIAADVGGKLGGCVVADLDPELPGNEIAVVGGDGGVHLIWRSGDGWQHRRPFTTTGESIQCVAGDLMAQHKGDELVTLGMAEGGEDSGGPGRATAMAMSADRSAWLKTLIESEALIHAGALGDLDPAQEGNELAYAGFFGEARLLSPRGRPQVLGPLPGNAKGAAIGVGGVVFACDDGSLVRFRLAASGWRSDVLFKGGQGLARVAATDEQVLFSANDGYLRLWRDGETRVLLESSDRLRGAVIGDLDPTAEGLEYATAGYDGVVTVVRDEGDRMVTTGVGHDPERFHHLASGELPGLGLCLVACGYGGRVLVIGHGQNRK